MKIAVFFGGKSCEHDISIITGVMTLNAAAVRHDVIPVYIDGGGRWLTGKGFKSVAAFSGKVKGKEVHLRPASPYLYGAMGRRLCKLDAAIICCHGKGGEDGCLSGLLELCGVPYVGSNVLASAIGMDKVMQKRLFKESGLNVTNFVSVEKYQLNDEFFDLVSRIGALKFPLIIKPSNLGSSIGISRAADFKELFIRLEEAFEWDERVLIEEALIGFTEVNCAVLGHGNRLLVSEIEQPLSSGFLSYDDKYMRGGKTFQRDLDGLNHNQEIKIEEKENISDCQDVEMGSGKGLTGRYIPAHISPETSESVRDTAKKVFQLIGCSGVARVDFLIKDDVLYVNEINTVPGSLSSYLFAFDGISFPLLIDKLLETAFDAEKSKARLKYTFDSDVLRNAGKGIK